MTKEQFEKEFKEAVGKLVDGANLMVSTDPNWIGINEKDKAVMKSIYVGLSVQQVKHDCLLSLLVSKKLITEDEYNSTLCLSLKTEKERFERYLSGRAGKQIKL